MAQDDEDLPVLERPAAAPEPALPAATPSVPDTGSFGTTFMPQPASGGQVEPALPATPAPAGGFLADAGYDPAKTEAVSQELGGVLREKQKAQGWADADADRKLSQDRERMDRAYRMEQSSVDDPALKPWKADKERNDRIRGPMEQFGSIGSVFAMAASMFTKTPMTSALNAGAAAMRSIQEHDEKGYESAYAAWKDNSSLALKRFEMERNLFDDANKLANTDLQQWSARRLAIAAKFDDKKAIVMLENGMSQELLDLDAKKVTMAKSLQEQMKGFEEFDRDRRIYKDGMDAFKAENPNATPSQDVQHRLQLLHDIKSGARSWQQEALRNFELTHPNATAEERGEFMKSLRGGLGGTGGLTLNKEDASEIERRKQEKIKAGMEPGKAFEEAKAEVAATNPTKMTGSQFDTAGALELMRKNPELSMADAKKQYADMTKPGASMTPEAVDMNARLLIRGNPAAIQNVGRGKQGEATLAAIKNRATEILLKERGLDAEKAAELINQNTAAFMGDKRGASNLALRMSTIFGAATTALATADRVIETSEKVDRSEFSDLNKVILSAERRTGGKEVIDFGIAVNTLVNNYARAVGGGSSTLTDTARREAHELLQKEWSKGQVKSAVAQLKRELYFELEGAREARKAWQEGGTPFPGGNVPDSGSGVIEYDSKGNRIEKK